MTPERTGICALIGVAAVILLYATSQQTSDKVIVPDVQGEMQFLGTNVNGALSFNPGSALDMNEALAVHFWAPGYNPRDGMDNDVCTTPHRYPRVPGGNVSSVMHKGWGSFLANCPPGRDWFYNPPEAAVL